MDAQSGTIERWIKKEGDSFLSTDTICEATLGDLTIGRTIDDFWYEMQGKHYFVYLLQVLKVATAESLLK